MAQHMNPLHTTNRYFDRIIKWSFDFEDQSIPQNYDFSYLLGFLPIEEPYISKMKIDRNYQGYLEKVLPHLKWNPPIEFSGNKNPSPFWYYHSLSESQYLQLSNKKNWFKFLEQQKIIKHQFLILNNLHELIELMEDPKQMMKTWLIKSFQGFSGRNHSILNSTLWLIPHIREQSQRWIFPLIAEEYFLREVDFSIFLSPYQKFELIYQNEVDQYFQYRGTTIEKSIIHDIPSFLKKFNVDNDEILKFIKNYELIKTNLFQFVEGHAPSSIWGGSMDSFIYFSENNNGRFIHPGCEFNFRKTMGLVSYLLWKHVTDSCLKMKLVFLPRKNTFSSFRKADDYYQECIKLFNQDRRLILTPFGISPIIEIQL